MKSQLEILQESTWKNLESVKTWGWELLILCIAGFYISNVMTIWHVKRKNQGFSFTIIPWICSQSLQLCLIMFADQPKHNQHGEEVLREFLLCVVTWVYSWSSELLPFCIKLQLQYWNPSSLVHLLWLHYLHSSPLVHLRFVLQNHNGEIRLASFFTCALVAAAVVECFSALLCTCDLCCRKTAEKSDWHPDFQSFQVPLYVALQKGWKSLQDGAPWWLSFALILSAFLLWKLNLFISTVSKCARNVQQCDTGISNNQQEIKQKQHMKKLAQRSRVPYHPWVWESITLARTQSLYCKRSDVRWRDTKACQTSSDFLRSKHIRAVGQEYITVSKEKKNHIHFIGTTGFVFNTVMNVTIREPAKSGDPNCLAKNQ